MSLILNDEQQSLKEGAARYFRDAFPVADVRNRRDTDQLGFDITRWEDMAELGWAGVLVDSAFGGLGLGMDYLAPVLEEAGRTLANTPLISTAVIAATLLGNARCDEQRNLLQALVAGDATYAFALDEEAHHTGAFSHTVAKAEGAIWRISGDKRLVCGATSADYLIVAAILNDQPALLVVDRNASGVRIQPQCMLDSSDAARVQLDDAEANVLLATGDVAERAIAHALRRARIALAASMLGSCEEAFARILGYLKTREQFGVLIGSFQALKHRAAAMFCEIELCKSVVRHAAFADAHDNDDADSASWLAKAQCNDTLTLIANEGVQMFGGIGMTDEEEIGFFLKRAKVATVQYGSSRFCRNQYATRNGY